MVETGIDANIGQEGLGASSAPQDEHLRFPDTADLHSDVDGEPDVAKPDQKGDGDAVKPEEEAKGDKEPVEDKTGKKGQEGRFDKDPDWQRIMKARDEAIERAARAEAVLERIEKSAKEDKSTEEAPSYKDITQMEADKLREWQEDDPVGYAANLYAQVLSEVRQQIKTEQTQSKQTESITSTFTKFGEKHPDFQKMWDSGEVKKFMDANPGHNAMSAFHELTAEKRIQEAAEKAAKEAKEKVISDLKAKRGAAVLSDSPSISPPGGKDVELTDTKQRGGLTSVLANRLRSLRESRAA